MLERYLETLEGRLRGPARRSVLTGGRHWDGFTSWLACEGGRLVHEQRQLEIWRDPLGFFHMKFNGTVGISLPPRIIESVFGSVPDMSRFAENVNALGEALNVAIVGGYLDAGAWAFLESLRGRYMEDLEQWKIWARAQVRAGSLNPVEWKE